LASNTVKKDDKQLTWGDLLERAHSMSPEYSDEEPEESKEDS
jgi:hypothetical protein